MEEQAARGESHGADAGGRRGVLLLPSGPAGGHPGQANANCVERCPVVVRRGHGAAAGDRAQLLGALAGGDLPRRLLHLHWFGELSFAVRLYHLFQLVCLRRRSSREPLGPIFIVETRLAVRAGGSHQQFAPLLWC